MDNFIDWLDQVVKVGDQIVYPVRHGSTVSLVLAEVLEINSATPSWSGSKRTFTVVAKPIHDHRYGERKGRTRYVDTRTGKGVDPWGHVEKHAYYGPDGWVETKYADYIQEVEMPVSPVTLTAVENIIKIRSV